MYTQRKVGSIHRCNRYISMYRIDRYHIEVISIFDLYFDMQTQGIREGFDLRPTGKKSDALPTGPQGLKHAFAKFFRNDLGF